MEEEQVNNKSNESQNGLGGDRSTTASLSPPHIHLRPRLAYPRRVGSSINIAQRYQHKFENDDILYENDGKVKSKQLYDRTPSRKIMRHLYSASPRENESLLGLTPEMHNLAIDNNPENLENNASESSISRPPLYKSTKSGSFIMRQFPRLSLNNLNNLPLDIKVPKYDPRNVKEGILHIGTGNFALAHLASFINDFLEFDNTWGIISTSIRSNRLVNLLKKQENLYILLEKHKNIVNPCVVASIIHTIFGGTDPYGIVDCIASPNIKLLTVTVTNNGYLIDSNLKLQLDSPDIQHDLNTKNDFNNGKLVPINSVYGYLAAGLLKRKMAKHNVPLTVMSLDNLPSNSKVFLEAFKSFLIHYDKSLINYVDSKVDFLVTLVDRITPEPTEAYKLQAQAQLKVRSFVIVGTETYRCLVVEKGRFLVPNWEKVGVKVVDDCSSYMKRKFYLLNAAHMIIAMCGCRLGCKFIHNVVEIPEISLLLDKAFSEWLAFLPGVKSELEEYVNIVKERISDYSINDSVKRVASRLTSKLPERIVSGALLYKKATGRPMVAAAFTIALYLQCTERKNEKGGFFNIIDNDAHKAAPAYKYTFYILRILGSTSKLPPLFPRNTLLKLADSLESDGLRQLADDDEFCSIFGECLHNLRFKGIRASIYLLLNMEVPPSLTSSFKRPIRPKRVLSYIA